MINSYLYIYITLSSADAPREGIPSPHNFNWFAHPPTTTTTTLL